MLEARSVAVVGASVKAASLGLEMMTELLRGGYEGAIYPVNPGYEEILGHRCYPSVAELPEPVDLVVLGVANHRVERALSEAVAAGARSAVTFASLHEEGAERGRPPLTERVAAIARQAGIPLCGGNGMGFLNQERHLRATGFATPDHLRHGPVTFISHSGSAFAAIAFNDRGIGLNLVVSSGQEIVSTMDDYMEYALGLPSTRVLALLLETVRDPEGFRAQLTRAAERDVPVLALKVGRTDGSKAMVTAHSGALAGEHGAYEALFEACGVLEARSLEEMADAMELFSSPRRVRSGSGIASVHDSGGERALFADLAHDLDVPFAEIGDATRERIQEALDPGLEAGNPLDAWGTGIGQDEIFVACLRALSEDRATAVTALVVDLTRQGEPYDEGYLHVAREVFARTEKPFCVLTNLASAVAEEEAGLLREVGIPVLEGTRSGLAALGMLLRHRDASSRPAVSPPAPVGPEVRERWRARMAEGTEIAEIEALRMLSDYGVPVIASRAAHTAEEAVEAAGALGYPVAIKTAAPGIRHKSDVSGVFLQLEDAGEVRASYDDLRTRLGPETVVAAMAPAGVELALGVVRDPQFGPLILVAAGGVLVELLEDRKLAVPPLDEGRARDLINGLRSRPLLDGIRGAPASDMAALSAALVRLSVLAVDLGDLVDALDVNPLIVSREGCIAVDALVVPRSA